MNKPNDTLLTTISKNIDLTTCPTIKEICKKDTGYHRETIIKLKKITPSELYEINRRQFNKNYRLIYCPYCGHQHPISRFIYNQIKDEIKKDWSLALQRSMTKEQIKLRNLKGGVNRAIRAGQQLKPTTIKKCTDRQISL